jgi:hypothetical protein
MAGTDPRGGHPRPPLCIRAFPADDQAFHAVVRASVSRAFGRGRLASLGDRVQGDVRNRYPEARIRVQDPIAAADDQLVVYAYRDGTLLRSTARERIAEPEAEAVTASAS